MRSKNRLDSPETQRPAPEWSGQCIAWRGGSGASSRKALNFTASRLQAIELLPAATLPICDRLRPADLAAARHYIRRRATTAPINGRRANASGGGAGGG